MSITQTSAQITPTKQMLRSENLFGYAVKGSRCVFVVNPLEGTSMPASNENVQWRYLAGNKVELSFDHEYGDAFSGLWMLSSWIKSKGIELQPIEESAFNHQHWKIESFQRLLPQPRPTHGYTAEFTSKLSNSREELEISAVSLVTALDDLRLISEETMLGNSFVIVNASFETLEKNSHDLAPFLHSRANKLLRYLQQNPEVSLKEVCPLLLSSIGSLGKLTWASEQFNTKTLMMVPTPIDPKSLNLVLWSDRTHQTLTICYHPEQKSKAKTLEELFRRA